MAKKHFVSYVIAMVSGISEIHTCANAGVNSGLLKGSRFMIKLYQLCRLYLCVYSFSRKAGIYPGTENVGFAFLALLFCGTCWQYHLPARPKGPCKTVFEPIRIVGHCDTVFEPI